VRSVSLGEDVCVDLELVQLSPPPGERWWVPFDVVDGFEPRWWCINKNTRDIGQRFVKVLLAGQEVARLELDDTLRLGELDHYAGVPSSAKPTLEIQLIEVSHQRRRERIATAVIDLLDARHPDHRLAAFSEQADDFWGSLPRWQRYVTKRSPHLSRTLFIRA